MTDVAILCGGLGTRLRSVLPPGMPKCLADINGRPFLSILLEHVRRQGFRRVILAAGYGVNYLARYVDGLKDKNIYLSGSPPTGTWQAIKNAKLLVRSDPFLVLNGDTFCDMRYGPLLKYHAAWPKGQVLATAACSTNFVNVGAFVLTKSLLLKPLECVNLEDALESVQGMVANYTVGAPFFDIGTPEQLDMFKSDKSRFTFANIGV